MEENNIDIIKQSFKVLPCIQNYLYEYLEDKIDELIDTYEIEEENINEIHIIGWELKNANVLNVYVQFFDEGFESGYGLEEYNVIISDFIDWLKNN